MLNPGEIYQYEIDLRATSKQFQRGHRQAVESTLYNRYDRYGPHDSDLTLPPPPRVA